MSFLLHALCASKGVTRGKIYTVDPGQLEISEYQIGASRIEDEVKRFRRAVRLAQTQLKEVRNRIPKNTAQEISTFIDTHLLMLQDSALTKVPTQIIRQRFCNAEWALKLQRDTLVSIFDEIEDPYLRTRKDDVDHVVTRIQRILLHQQSESEQVEKNEISLRGYVVLSPDLTASDIVVLHDQGVNGFITEFGGSTSHTAILARSLRIPAIVGMHQARSYLRDDDEVIIDGRSGVLLVEPDKRIIRHYNQLSKTIDRHHSARAKLRNRVAVTRDGEDIQLHANIELPGDVKTVKKVSAQGIGLFRTEFLYMNRDELPDEEEQFQAYVSVVKALKGKPVTIRTLDIGSDKPVRNQESLMQTAVNPAMGMRAIRMCLRDLKLFVPQLRAILRASAFGHVRLLVPMVSNIQELKHFMSLLNDIRNYLRTEGVKFDEKMQVGVMIEVPAAAIAADMFANRVDFLSIGTNDLIQYTLAADRIDDEVNYLYDPLHPAVLRLIEMVLNAATDAGVPVSMCGEMAADARYTRLLLGMGLREFSVPPNSLLEIKQLINASDTNLFGPMVHRIMHTADSAVQADLLDQLNKLQLV